MVSLGTQIKEQAKIVRDATTGERDWVLGRSVSIPICDPEIPSFHLPLRLVIAYWFFISQFTCCFLTQGTLWHTPTSRLSQTLPWWYPLRYPVSTVHGFMCLCVVRVCVCVYDNLTYAYLPLNCKHLDSKDYFCFTLHRISRAWRCSTNIYGVSE